VPSELDKMIKKWIKLNKSDYLLYSSNEKHLSSPQITRILNKVFGKRVSTDMLRHIFLTERYKNVPSIRDMEELATQMGHSTSTALEYVKKK
jgi:integrase